MKTITIVTTIAALIFICVSGFSKGNSSLAEIFNPPKDLFTNLYNEPVILKKNERIVFPLKHNYEGRYQVGLYFEKINPDIYSARKSIQTKLRLNLKFILNGDNYFQRELGEEVTSFLGKEGNGVILFVYEVPKDVPYQTKIVAELTVLKEDVALTTEFGSARIFVKKMSDL